MSDKFNRIFAKNYEIFRHRLKEQSGPPPLSSSRLRQGNGKGDANRVTDYNKYRKGYDAINWKSKGNKKNKKVKI